ncbi:MAG: hypothetical protein AAFW73_12945 [Bacteroidota bacterium]
MMTLNVSFGILAFMPQGWLFMLVIVVIEGLLLSRLLTDRWADFEVCLTVFIANVVSGLVGIIASLLLNGGWWLVVWFPWVSKHEVGTGEGLVWLAVVYLVAFVWSVLIEAWVNGRNLRGTYAWREVVAQTWRINAVSYLVGSLAMYGYGF